ncbi:lysM and putative peptidoglycan-binding domain-containing protein 1-like [Neopelma chrysocephalum]|uniref:lysM and putative peptidoglycan-binding domain-containing protein 1-like n=1 Tax=Neopelma chrysocephalum TaxID=114329 RepID=UPI000FCD1D61|nr:lysM and putative peptidoglycan-binding domain-containing protein 1-like [Neopelma chrysocephalum]
MEVVVLSQRAVHRDEGGGCPFRTTTPAGPAAARRGPGLRERQGRAATPPEGPAGRDPPPRAMAGSGGAGAAPREHRLQPGDTLAGLALRYGVTMEQIQRANRLYTSDTIFLKPTLLIPAGSQSQPLPGDEPQDIPDPPEPPLPSRHDLSAMEFLRHLDTEIGRSKAAAAQQIRHRRSG